MCDECLDCVRQSHTLCGYGSLRANQSHTRPADASWQASPMSLLSRVRWGHALLDRSHRGESWWWLAWSFVAGAPLSTAPAVVGSGSVTRAFPRLLGATAAGCSVYAYVLAPPAQVAFAAWASWATAAAALAVTGWQLAAWSWAWRHRRRWVRPLDVALRPQLGYPPNMPARSWLMVPRELADAEGGVRVYLPAGFVGRPLEQADDRADGVLEARPERRERDPEPGHHGGTRHDDR